MGPAQHAEGRLHLSRVSKSRPQRRKIGTGADYNRLLRGPCRADHKRKCNRDVAMGSVRDGGEACCDSREF